MSVCIVSELKSPLREVHASYVCCLASLGSKGVYCFSNVCVACKGSDLVRRFPVSVAGLMWMCLSPSGKVNEDYYDETRVE